MFLSIFSLYVVLDLKTIGKRLDSDIYYLTLDMFAADMKRMFANARTYNSPDTIYFKCANRFSASRVKPKCSINTVEMYKFS